MDLPTLEEYLITITKTAFAPKVLEVIKAGYGEASMKITVKDGNITLVTLAGTNTISLKDTKYD